MGIDHNIRMLPYIEIEAKDRFVERTVVADCCGRYMRDNAFCPSCGKPQRTTVKRLPVNYTFTIMDALKERLYCPIDDGPTHCWISNIAATPYAYIEPDLNAPGAYALPRDVDQVKASFAQAFASEIEVLRREYEAEPVIKFGVLVWYS